MRKIKYIVLHCTAGNQKNSAADVINYHCKTLGWRKPGYHFIIDASGNITEALPINEISNGVKASVTDAAGDKVNATAINISYIGGVDTSTPQLLPVDNRTAAQREALLSLLKKLRVQFPTAKIRGHRDFQRKACPSFDATKEYSGI